ncbi:MAG: PHD finger domain-containing protein [Candidatus Thorarchaeota archaeon]
MVIRKVSFLEAVSLLDSKTYPEGAYMNIEFECLAYERCSEKKTYGPAPYRLLRVTDNQYSIVRTLYVWGDQGYAQNMNLAATLKKGDRLLVSNPTTPRNGSYSRDERGNTAFWIELQDEISAEKGSRLVKITESREICCVCRRPITLEEEIIYCPSCQNPFHPPHFAETLKLTGKCPICATKSSFDEIMKNVAEIFDFPKNKAIETFTLARRTEKFHLKDNKRKSNYEVFPLTSTDKAILKEVCSYIKTRTGARVKVLSKLGRGLIKISYQDGITLDLLEKIIRQYEQTL